MTFQQFLPAWGFKCLILWRIGLAFTTLRPSGEAAVAAVEGVGATDSIDQGTAAAPASRGSESPANISNTGGTLEMRLQLEGPTLEVGQPVAISVVFSNSTDRPLIYNFWYPQELGFRLVVTDEYGQRVLRRAEARATNESPRKHYTYEYNVTARRVDPGGTSVVTFPFSSKYCLDKPGTYTVVGSVRVWETNANLWGWIESMPLVFRFGGTNAPSPANPSAGSSQLGQTTSLGAPITGFVSNTQAEAPVFPSTSGSSPEKPAHRNRGIFFPLVAVCGIALCFTVVLVAISKRVHKPR